MSPEGASANSNTPRYGTDAGVAPQLAHIDFTTMFDRLIVGPSAHPWVMYEAFTRALATAGVQNATERVVTSDIPLRTL